MIKFISVTIYLLVLLLFSIGMVDCLNDPARIAEHATANLVLAIMPFAVVLIFIVWDEI